MSQLLIQIIRQGRWRPRFEGGEPLRCETLREAYRAMQDVIVAGEAVCRATRGPSVEAVAVLDGDGQMMTLLSRVGYRKVAVAAAPSVTPLTPRYVNQEADGT